MDPALAAAFAQVPANRLLGLRLLERTPERTRVEMPARPELAQEEGVVQGGILTALADMAAVYLLWPDLPADTAMTGTSCTMHFLDAARPGDVPLRAAAAFVRRGRTLCVCTSRVTQGERLVAEGTFTFLLRSRR